MYTRALSIRYQIVGGEHVYSLLLGRTIVDQIVSDEELSDVDVAGKLLAAVAAFR